MQRHAWRMVPAFVAGSLCWAAATVHPANAAECELPGFNEGRTFIIEAWAVPDTVYNVGEPLGLQMRTSTPSFVTLFHVSTSCKVTRLLQNSALRQTEIVNYPFAGSGLQITVKPPAGAEGFYFVATRNPFEFLSQSDILSQSAGIAWLDLNPQQFFRRLDDALGRVNPDDWSVTTLHTRVVAH